MSLKTEQFARLAENALAWLYTQPEQAIFLLAVYSMLFLLMKKCRHI